MVATEIQYSLTSGKNYFLEYIQKRLLFTFEFSKSYRIQAR